MNRINGGNMSGFETGVKSFIGATFVVVIVMIVLTIIGIIYGCNYVRENGVKGVVESVWNGTNGTNGTNTTNSN